MNELIVINAKTQITWLELKLMGFIFPEPITTLVLSDIYNELYLDWRKKTRDIESEFPSQFLLDRLGIEGVYERSYFTRVMQNFQRQINDLLLSHGVFDDLANGNYFSMTVHKYWLRFEPTVPVITNARICDSDYRFSKRSTQYEHSTRIETGAGNDAPTSVLAKRSVSW